MERGEISFQNIFTGESCVVATALHPQFKLSSWLQLVPQCPNQEGPIQ